MKENNETLENVSNKKIIRNETLRNLPLQIPELKFAEPTKKEKRKRQQTFPKKKLLNPISQ
jgi:hypothetical protein